MISYLTSSLILLFTSKNKKKFQKFEFFLVEKQILFYRCEKEIVATE